MMIFSKILQKEKESYQIIDKELIEFSIDRKDDKEVISEFVKLDRKARIMLSDRIKLVIEQFNQHKYCMSLMVHNDIIYVVDCRYNYFNTMQFDYYFKDILLPLLIYKLDQKIDFSKIKSIIVIEYANATKPPLRKLALSRFLAKYEFDNNINFSQYCEVGKNVDEFL
jgi:hypothetical protein